MKVYALRIKNRDELMKSSSGGAFTAISDYFLSKGNAVVSAIYNYETNQTEFSLYTTKEERNKARGSKYMQAYPMNSFKEAEKWVAKNQRPLVFVGMGCQAEAFRKYADIKGFRDNVLTVGIICHGTPSPQIWKDYIKQKVDYVTFRDKRQGWDKPTAYAMINGNEKSIADFMTLFYDKCSLRPACYECPFATTERKVDITIGDFWGIDKVMTDFYSPEGASLVLVHTAKGEEIFEKIKSQVEWRESNKSDCLQPNLINPTERPAVREKFWRDYNKMGLDYIVAKNRMEASVRGFARKIKYGLLKKRKNSLNE